jgi:hypothetical protein
MKKASRNPRGFFLMGLVEIASRIPTIQITRGFSAAGTPTLILTKVLSIYRLALLATLYP